MPRGLGHNVPIRAVLFDLGNTLIGYYVSAEFPSLEGLIRLVDEARRRTVFPYR
jgi:predicted HAD superfamily phosphohydrolase YqeG